MICSTCGDKRAESGRDECFRCRVSTVGISFHGGVRPGRTSWNRSKTEWMNEHLGTTSEKELAQRGLVRADTL